MIATAPFRERLGSAAAAIALQLAVAALLALSFNVVRQAVTQKETILLLPPLPAQPAPVRPPVVIDARPRPGSSAVPAAPPVLPSYAQPSFHYTPPASETAPLSQAVPDAARGAAKCGGDRTACPPPGTQPQPDAADAALHPPSHVKDVAKWEAELNRNKSPLDSGLTHNGGIGFGIQDPLCKLTRFLIRGTFGCGAAPSNHYTTETQFLAARAAVQARQRSLYPRPVLASGANGGDSDEKNSSSGGAGVAGGDGNTDTSR